MNTQKQTQHWIKGSPNGARGERSANSLMTRTRTGEGQTDHEHRREPQTCTQRRRGQRDGQRDTRERGQRGMRKWTSRHEKMDAPIYLVVQREPLFQAVEQRLQLRSECDLAGRALRLALGNRSSGVNDEPCLGRHRKQRREERNAMSQQALESNPRGPELKPPKAQIEAHKAKQFHLHIDADVAQQRARFRDRLLHLCVRLPLQRQQTKQNAACE
jgi:hypothetical protein